MKVTVSKAAAKQFKVVESAEIICAKYVSVPTTTALLTY